ncbi:hypothetical protein FACS1894181_17660 [Bacteroidia bacterium]|nr:hypothetical protein FACS1894181_17660 [Bacteroidia bacterium]
MLVFAAFIGWEGYEALTGGGRLESLAHGSLSDIAKEVRAIPLQTAGPQKLEHIRNVRVDGNDLFLVSNHILYHFDVSGKFLGQITGLADISVATYVIDQPNRQLIVLGNANSVHYYSYEGHLTGKMHLDASAFHSLEAVEMYGGYIWAAGLNEWTDSVTRQKYAGEQLVKYDTSFRKVDSYQLASADLPGKPVLPSFMGLGIGVDERTGQVYACASPLAPDYLLRDSLALVERKRTGSPFADGEAGVKSIYPMRFGKRFWIASSVGAGLQDYIYCFDSSTSRSWQVESLDDNFFRTGAVSRLQPVDICSHSYYFCKSGETLKESFPGQTVSGNPVVFIVQLKT